MTNADQIREAFSTLTYTTQTLIEDGIGERNIMAAAVRLIMVLAAGDTGLIAEAVEALQASGPRPG